MGHRTASAGITATMVLALLTGACDVHEPIVIPANAESVVHVTATEDSVTIEPSTVSTGDVYFVLEGPNTAVSFVARKEAPDAPIEGMDAAQVERLTEGDYQFTAMDGFAVTCAPDEWTEERHWAGCGENHVLPLRPGLYALLASGEAPGVAPVMAVLEVTP
jgi:hypothetical protein